MAPAERPGAGLFFIAQLLTFLQAGAILFAFSCLLHSMEHRENQAHNRNGSPQEFASSCDPSAGL
jgi:hypothetical protein